jgi:trigger factor
VEFNLDKKEASYASLTVNVAEGDYKTQFDSKIKEYSKQVNIKGFRPGKVPSSVVKRMAGEKLLTDVVFKLLSDSVNEYIKTNEIQLVGEPLPTLSTDPIDFNTQKEFKFTYDLGLIPDYTLEFSDKLKFDKFAIEIDDKTLEETIDGLKKQFSVSESPEEVGTEGLLAGEITIGDEQKVVSIDLANLLKKEVTKFTGRKVEDVLTFDIDNIFKKDGKASIIGISKEEIEALAGEISFKLTSITIQKEGELNQEFFDKVLGPGKATNEEEFITELKVILTANYNRDADAFLFNKVRESLVENTTIDLSQEFLLRWILESNRESKLEKADVEKEMDNYLKEFKWSIIKGKIATDAEIKVSQDEVKAKALEGIKAQFFGGAEVPAEMDEQLLGYVDKYLQEDNNKNYYNTFEQVLAEKLFDHVKTVVTINDKAISAEDFKKEIAKK